MRIDIQKLDERIRQLQEVRRVAVDPELSTILMEFVSSDDAGPSHLPPRHEDGAAVSQSDETHRDLVQEVINGNGFEPRDGIWSRKR